MRNIEQIKKVLKKNKKTLRAKYNVKEIGVFGSYIRGEQSPESDVDLLVEFSKPIGFFAFLDLEEYLKKEIGAKVDLVTKGALKPLIKSEILDDVIYV